MLKRHIIRILNYSFENFAFLGAYAVFFFLGICTILFSAHSSPTGNNILGSSQRSASNGVSVSLSIGIHKFTLYGYSSPGALINLQGMGIVDETIADPKGYFEFNNRFSPFSPREACLTSTDQFGRISSPVCLPPFPTEYDIVIGPVLMPPTISFDKSDYFMGDQVILTGQAIPGTDVDLSVYIDDSPSLMKYLSSIFTLVKPAYAFTFPQLKTTSDAQGNFSLSLPSANADVYRLFAQSTYESEASPKSITLNVRILPIWMLIVKFIGFLFSLLKSRLLEFLILVQLLGIVWYFLRRYLKPYIIANSRALVLRDRHELLLQEHSLVKR